MLKICIAFVFSCIFILLSRESDQCAVRARLELPAICLPHQDGEIPPSAFPNGITQVNLLACSPHCPSNAERQAGKL